MALENTIRKIIEADHEARKRVAETEALRGVVRSQMEAQRMEITKRYKDEINLALQAHKDELKEQKQVVQETKNKEYEETLRTLQDSFTKKKDIWIEEIVKRCLEH